MGRWGGPTVHAFVWRIVFKAERQERWWCWCGPQIKSEHLFCACCSLPKTQQFSMNLKQLSWLGPREPHAARKTRCFPSGTCLHAGKDALTGRSTRDVGFQLELRQRLRPVPESRPARGAQNVPMMLSGTNHSSQTAGEGTMDPV